MRIRFPIPERWRMRLQQWWRQSTPQSLLGRSLLILILPPVLSLAIGLFVFFDRHWSTTTMRLANSLSGEVALVQDAWNGTNGDENRQQDLMESTQDHLGLTLQFLPTQKLPVTKRLSIPGLDQLLQQALNEHLETNFAITRFRGDGDWVIINVPVNNGLLKIYVPKKRLFTTTTYVFLLFMVGSSLLLSIIAVIFMRNQIRPVRKLAIAAERFGKGLDTPRFRPTGASEVRQAAQAFLEMRERIQRQMRQRTDMLSGVSHDLRTPLTRMKLQLALQRPNEDVKAMQHDIAAMEHMINAYLDFARSETLEQLQRCDLSLLISQTVDQASRHGLEVMQADIAPDIQLVVRPHNLQRAFANILHNAQLYAGHAWLQFYRSGMMAVLLIDDNGPGIPDDLRNDVFRPFFRLDDARNQDIEGTGLGLAIAQDIIHAHGGTIHLGVAPQGGLRVQIELPL